MSPELRLALPVSFECKNTQRLNPWSAIRQAEANAEGYTPVVVFSRNREKKPYAIIEAIELLKIYKDLASLKEAIEWEEPA